MTIHSDRARSDQLMAEARTCREQANAHERLGVNVKADRLRQRANDIERKANALRHA